MTDSSPLPLSAEVAVHLRLYITSGSARSHAAELNLRRLPGADSPEWRLEVIDLRLHPELAARDQIIAVPTLVRAIPKPTLRIVGDLSDSRRVLRCLGLVASIAPFAPGG
jgi:circadian clock protein KaiB